MAENKKEGYTSISTLGEFGLIEKLTAHLKKYNESSNTVAGDDGAVIKYEGEEHTVISSDMFLEGVHFDLLYTPLLHLGYKCIVAAISDIVAMNAKPGQVLVNLAISNKYSVEMVEELYKGMETACANYKVDVVGGDTSSSRTGMVLSITALGSAPASKIVYRTGAKTGDIVCVTGDLGAAYLGLQLLEREKRVLAADPQMKPELTGYEYLLQRQLKPETRVDVIHLLGELKLKPTAMIDISDGLASDLLHLCNKSNKGVKIYEENIPVDPMAYNAAMDFNLDPTLCALNGGEDYELIFTLPASEKESVENDPDITVIGVITDASEGSRLITRSGAAHPLQAQGWNAFPESGGEA
ncbi:MAG: thiamine-phosphate kinase [Bacteroidia bacterium]